MWAPKVLLPQEKHNKPRRINPKVYPSVCMDAAWPTSSCLDYLLVHQGFVDMLASCWQEQLSESQARALFVPPAFET